MNLRSKFVKTCQSCLNINKTRGTQKTTYTWYIKSNAVNLSVAPFYLQNAER